MNRYLVPDDCGRAHCLASIAPGELPTERLIFPAGEFVTTKGTFLFDAEAAAAVMADWNEWTGGLPQKGSSDYEHDQSKDSIPGHLKLDSSSYDLELRDGALWTVNIRWTDLAAGMIERREKRFTSPWWLYEKASKRIIRYINFGLVSMPATLAQPELIAGAAASRGQVAVPDLFAGYAVAAKTEPVPEPIAAAEPEPEPVATPAPEPTTTTPQGETSTMPDYKDPGFQPTMHGWDLRDMTSSALHNMQCSVRLHNEVPMLAAAMELPKHVQHLAEHVAHCAAAMVHHMVTGDDMPEDVDATKLPPEVAAKVVAAITACKTVKIGAAKSSRVASETAAAHSTALASVQSSLTAAQAAVATETAKRIAAEKAADQVKFDALIEQNRTKILKGAQEDWVRANIVGKEAKDGQAAVSASDALAAHIATLKPVAVAQQHNPPGGASATSQSTADERAAIIRDVQLTAEQYAAWAQTGGGEDRFFHAQEAQAKRLGLVT